MNALIQIQPRDLDGATVQTVNARDLHGFLEVGKDFSTWIKNRIEQYEFAENQDFATFEAAPQNGGAGNRGVRVEYALSLGMAKELAMVERNDKGKQARQYFIECERRANAPQIDPASLTRMDLIKLAMEAEAERLALEHQVAELEPKAIALDRFANHEGKHNVRNSAKLLGIRERLFTTWLIAHDWMYRDHGGRLCAKSGRLADGCLDTAPVEVQRSDGIHTYPQPFITQKGLARLAVLLARDGLIPKEAA